MRISLLQINPLTAGQGRNLQDVDTLLGSGNGADIYILPEMFNTGFCIDPASIAQTIEGETIKWMRYKAKQLNAAFAGDRKSVV